MIIAPGSVSISLGVQIVDDSGLPTTGLVAATWPTTYYSRAGETLPAAISLSDLAAQNSAYASGGVKELAGGYYRLDVPNPAFATASRVRIIGEATGKHVLYPPITCLNLPIADPLLAVVPGAYAAGTAGFDIGQTYARLGSVSVTFTSPLSTDGGTLQIIRGDDYAFADGRQVGPFTDSGGTWPNLTGGTARLLTFPSAGTGLNLVGTITNPGTANQGVYFEPLAAQTSIQTLGGYPFHVVFTLSNGHTVTQIEGNTIVT